MESNGRLAESPRAKIKILGLCSYPIEAASTRYRLSQFVAPLAEKGIELTVSSFLSSRQFGQFYEEGNLLRNSLRMWRPFLRRLREVFGAGSYDLIIVQREAMIFGPAFFEWLFQKIGRRPLILDLDDAKYVRYVSPTYGKIGSFFKFFGKTDALIERADLVICGNRFIAEYVEKKGAKAVVIPTVVDTAIFHPVKKKDGIPIVGWIGTHSTFPLLRSLYPVLQKLSQKHEFILKAVGTGRERIEIEGVKIENPEWDLEREVADFQSFDIGLYPIVLSSSASKEWLTGKSGFKAIQYMSVGIPFVMTPVGVCAEIGEPGRTHFNATSEDDWYNYLDKLLSDERLRGKMGENGREHSLKYYALPLQTERLARALYAACGIRSEDL